MNKTLLSIPVALLLFAAIFSSCQKTRSGTPRILVYSNDSTFSDARQSAFVSLEKLGQEHDFLVDTTSDAALFVEDSLRNYSAVVFLNTLGDALNNYQEADFQRYINAGGGFVGVHSAANTEIDWGWYGRLVGGYFSDVSTDAKEGSIVVVDKKHAAGKTIPEGWRIKDEWYVFKEFYDKVNVLLTVETDVFAPQVDKAPVSWYHDYEGGRSFYTSIGGQASNYSDPTFLEHLLGGIKYAIGNNPKLDYSKTTTLRVPAADGFQKVSMAEGEFYEPTEMAILPNLDILIAQRRGELILFNKEENSVSQVGLLDVYHETQVPNVNAEEGFMGLTIDPDFANNNYIYTFYSPKDTSVNRLSRFVFKNNKLDMSSEKIILQFYSQRDICCHTGGSLAFGKDNILFLSTGDNSTPFDEPGEKYVSKGYSPRDLRPGHEQYDVSRSSANTNDLRGKVLRIKINADGSYDIPEGNLFAQGKEKTKPEIYAMGMRNPYRISIDKKTGYLYWGDVGPDASEDGEKRGPRGYDEVNQARTAGFFGWPFFIGDNYSYYEFNYGTGESGSTYDPQKPVNNSPNNTGLTELPSARPAFIWYPYAASPDFPQVASGGRNAMAGPVYYTELYPSESRYPDYYDGKLIIYDWIRGWVKAVSMLPNGDFNKMEPFIPQIKFNSPIDMEVGPDGKIYVLEYGSGWFSKNEDSGLARIDYSANPAAKVSAGAAGAQAVNTTMGHQQPVMAKGESLIAASDCKSCHSVDKKSVGPTYKAVAERYRDNKDASDLLTKKIMNGGSGNWGEVAMAAHPGLEESDVKEMVSWILSL